MGSWTCETRIRSKELVDDEVEDKESWKEILTSRIFLQTFFSVVVVTMATSTIYYGLAFQAAMLPGTIYVNNAINGIVDILGFVLITVVMNFWPRRRIIVVGFCLVILSSITCGVLFYYGATSLIQAGRWVTFVCKFFMSAIYGLLFAYGSELFPTSVRSIGASAVQVGDQFGILLGPYVLLLSLAWLPYLTFGCLSLLSIILTLATLAETYNRHIPETLVQMRRMSAFTVSPEIE